MIPGVTAFGEEALSVLPDAFDLSVPNPLSVLLAQPSPAFRYLLLATPFDPVQGTEITVYAASRSFATRPSDTPANQFFPGRLSSVLNWQLTLFDGDEPGGGRARSFGDIRLDNPDGTLDAWTGYEWDGRSIEIKVGGLDFTFDQFERIFFGTAAQLVAEEDALAIQIRDRALILGDPIQQTLYAGTGSLEGSDDLEGTPKPLAFGIVRNVTPVVVDRASLVYQVHDGAIAGIDAVRDQGIGLTSGGDVADLYAVPPAPGQYLTDNTRGLFRLGASPAGQVTADLRGDSAGGYVDTTGAIVRRIVTTRLGSKNIADPAGLDVPSFVEADTILPAAIGLYIAGEAPTARDVLDRLMSAAAGFWSFTRSGELLVGVLQAPVTATESLTVSDIQSQQLARVRVSQPSHRRRLGYQVIHTVQRDDDLAAGVSDDDRDLLGAETRTVTAEAPALVRTQHVLARDVEELTLIDDGKAAGDEVARRQAVFGERRARFQVSVLQPNFRFYPRQTVQLVAPRFGLNSGKDFIVAGMTEDLSTGETVLELWG